MTLDCLIGSINRCDCPPNGAYYWLGIHAVDWTNAPASDSYDWYDGRHVTSGDGSYEQWASVWPNNPSQYGAVGYVETYDGWINLPTSYDGTGYSNICEIP